MSSLVVVGDTVLDRDVHGDTERVCPDAPALVLTEQRVTERPGGAGLAAQLAAAGGHSVTLVTALAEDEAGARLSRLLAEAGVTVRPLPLAGATPEKVRLRAGGQVLLRLDRGGGEPAAAPSGSALAAVRDAGAVLVSDYGGGVTGLPQLRAALAEVAGPVVWDPHPRGTPPVPGTRLVTPNEAELAALSGVVAQATDSRRLAALTEGAQWLRERWRVGAVAVTLGADGALLCHAGATPMAVPAPLRAVGDTCGAGDRFATAVALALAGGAVTSEAVEQAVAAAAGYVHAGGSRPAPATAPPVPPGAVSPGRVVAEPVAPEPMTAADAESLVADVRAHSGTVVATGGCFDLLHAGHVATLQAARALGDCLVVCLNSDTSVAGLKGPGRPLVSQPDRIRLLSALACVDAVVVFDEPTPSTVLERLRPDIWVKGGDYGGGTPERPELPEAELVRRWGGQTVVVPYLSGRSTTGIIAAARHNGGGHRHRVDESLAPPAGPTGGWPKGV